LSLALFCWLIAARLFVNKPVEITEQESETVISTQAIHS
jgi:hypothetical protein